jgi:hypothetical protein
MHRQGGASDAATAGSRVKGVAKLAAK